MTSAIQRCPDCNEPTPTGGWIDQCGRTHHVGCGDPLGHAAIGARAEKAERELADTLRAVLHHFGPEGAQKVTQTVIDLQKAT